MRKKVFQIMLVLTLWFSTTGHSVTAASNDVYVSPAGNDANTCTVSAPCKTIQKGVNTVQPGGVLHILAGTYAETVSVSKVGTPTEPIRIVSEGAIMSNGGSSAFNVKNSQWLSFEGFTIKGYTLMDFEIRQSHYLTFKKNSLEYTFAAIRIQDGVSHVLVENNEMYQTYPAGSTWSALKGSKYEGAGVYASNNAQGVYYIRGNNFHDSMNGIYLSDTDPGAWMNANVFISGNTFTNIVDDPFEPEGDSFNIHFFNNTLVNTHRMASIVPASTCAGPIFVYGNYQKNTLDPTGEAASGRRNSVLKLDMRGGNCPNGVWVFNNTVDADVTGTNFYAVDMLSTSVYNLQLMNNVFVTEKNAYSGTPIFSNAIFDYNISRKPFGYTEPHSLQADPLLTVSGTLQTNSPAIGRGSSIFISNYLASSQVVMQGSNLGAFRSFPAPVYVTPPGGEPAGFPANTTGWPDAMVIVPAAETVTPTAIAASPNPTNTAPITPTSTPVTIVTATFTPTTAWTPTQPAPTATSQVEIVTNTPLPTQVEATKTQPPIEPTATTVVDPSPTASGGLTATPLATTPSVSNATFDDMSTDLVYSGSWQNVSKKQAYKRSFKTTDISGSYLSFKFTGSTFTILHTKGPAFTTVDVYVDNVLVGTINEKAKTLRYQRQWIYPGQLPFGPHELKLVFTGSGKSKGNVDAIIIQ